MSSKVKIYTRTGDKGQTSLYGGKRIFKNSLRVNAYGSVDELNSLLGVVNAKHNDDRLDKFINLIQSDLFVIGSKLAGAKIDLEVLNKRIVKMEEVIDELDEKLPELKNFILPEGTDSAAFLFFTRAVCRRVERELVSLSLEEEVDSVILGYFNRLSDLLFIMGRYFNFITGVKEATWKNEN